MKAGHRNSSVASVPNSTWKPGARRLTWPRLMSLLLRGMGSLDQSDPGRPAGRVSVATSGDVRDQLQVADAASELLQDIFEKGKNPCRLVYRVASLPLGMPVDLEVIFDVGRAE